MGTSSTSSLVCGTGTSKTCTTGVVDVPREVPLKPICGRTSTRGGSLVEQGEATACLLPLSWMSSVPVGRSSAHAHPPLTSAVMNGSSQLHCDGLTCLRMERSRRYVHHHAPPRHQRPLRSAASTHAKRSPTQRGNAGLRACCWLLRCGVLRDVFFQGA